MKLINIYSYPPIISALLFLSLGIFVVFKAQKKYFIFIPFALVCLSTIWWQGTWAILFNVKNRELALFLVKFGYSGIIFIPFTFYHFIVSWVGLKKEKAVVSLFYIIGVVFLCFLWSSDYFISGFYEYFWGYYPKAGILHPLYLLFLSISALRIFIVLVTSLKKETLKPIERNQVKYVLASIAIYTLAASDFLVNYGIEFYPPGVIFIIVSLFLLSYAIMHYQFMDVNIFYRKALTDILLFLIIGASFFFIVSMIEKVIFNSVNSRFIVLNFLTTFFLILFSYLFRKLKPATEKKVERMLFKDKYDYLESLAKLGQRATTCLDLDKLLDDVVNSLAGELKLDDVAVYIFQEDAQEYYLAKDFNPASKKVERLTLFDPCIAFLNGKNRIIIWDEERQCSGEVLARVNEAKIAVTVPLVFEKKMVGIVQLSDRITKEIYSHEDLELLHALAERISSGLANAKEHGASDELYRIRSRHERITSLAELGAGLCHQLNNPLMPIKGFLQLVGREGHKLEDLGVLKGEAEKAVDRIVKIIKEVEVFSETGLNIAHIQADVNAVLRKAVPLIVGAGPEPALTIDLDENLPTILGDERALLDIFVAIGTNGMEAMFERRRDKNANARDLLKSGIPPEDLAKIFNPMHSTKSMHIGLSLAIAHRLVEAHGGYMDVKSKVGEGTSFFVNLPLAYNPSRKETTQDKEAQREGQKTYMGMDVELDPTAAQNESSKIEKEEIKKLLDKVKKERGD